MPKSDKIKGNECDVHPVYLSQNAGESPLKAPIWVQLWIIRDSLLDLAVKQTLVRVIGFLTFSSFLPSNFGDSNQLLL
jgi:hypothetical protein